MDSLFNLDNYKELQEEIATSRLANEAVFQARQLLFMALDVVNVDRTKNGKPIFESIAMLVKVDQPENYKQIN
ncbi:MAG: hypothetical protein WC143_07860 [Eubacteriales bacterium]|jgi:hypothetical protein